MKKLLASMCLLLTIFISGCECSLHTHYYNDYGVCICGADIAQVLHYEDGEYRSVTQSVEYGAEKVYYYKLTAHGGEGFNFHIESENMRFDRIEIRADGMLQTVAGPVDTTNTNYRYTSHIIEDRVYYFKITYRDNGSVKFIVTEENN